MWLKVVHSLNLIIQSNFLPLVQEDYIFRRMIANIRLENTLETQAMIQEIIHQYEQTLSSNFQKKESKLIQQLFEEAKQKKKQLAALKKALSQQNIDRLISQRRRQKEKQRQKLQTRWRECNQSYKKFQEEQKRLINQQQQSLLDMKKLEEAIKQFQIRHSKLQNRLNTLQTSRNTKFMTEAADSYSSPYKRQKSPAFTQQISIKKINKLNQTSNLFFSEKYSIKKNIENRPKTQLSNLAYTNLPTSISNKILAKTSIAGKRSNLPKRIVQEQNQKENYRSQLMAFLSNTFVKQKLFEILNKQMK